MEMMFGSICTRFEFPVPQGYLEALEYFGISDFSTVTLTFDISDR